MASPNYCTFYIVRHGETEWNVERRMQGHGDSPLTQNGINQAHQTGQKLAKINFDAVFSSDLARASKTAAIIALDRKLAVNTTKLLRECCLGALEGRLVEEVRDILEIKSNILEEEKSRHRFVPDAESDEEIVRRFITFLREVAVSYANKTVLVVSHSQIIRALLIHLGFGTYTTLPPGAISNAGFVKLRSDGLDFFIDETEGVTKN